MDGLLYLQRQREANLFGVIQPRHVALYPSKSVQCCENIKVVVESTEDGLPPCYCAGNGIATNACTPSRVNQGSSFLDGITFRLDIRKSLPPEPSWKVCASALTLCSTRFWLHLWQRPRCCSVKVSYRKTCLEMKHKPTRAPAHRRGTLP